MGSEENKSNGEFCHSFCVSGNVRATCSGSGLGNCGPRFEPSQHEKRRSLLQGTVPTTYLKQRRTGVVPVHAQGGSHVQTNQGLRMAEVTVRSQGCPHSA